MERKGVMFQKLFLPPKIKIEVKKLDNEKWSLYYLESFEDEVQVPNEAYQFTMEMAKKLGINPKRRGNTFSYKFTGSIEQISGVIAGEFIQFTPLGKMTLTEMLALVGVGLAYMKERSAVKTT